MSFDNGFNQLGVAWNNPRSHTVDAKCNLTRSSGVGGCSGVLDGGRTAKIKSVAYLWGLVYFFRKFVSFRFVSAH